MKNSVLKRAYCCLILMVVLALVSASFVAQPYDLLCLPVRAQDSGSKAAGQMQQNQLPQIDQVVFLVQFSQEDKTRGSWVGQATVVSDDAGFRMENIESLVSSGWWQGIGAFSMSPDGTRLLVARTSPKATDDEQRDLALVSLPSREVTILRGDGAGYGVLGWSSDGQLVSYVSPIPVAYSTAHANESSDVHFVSFTGQDVAGGRYESPPRALYISAADGRWRRRLQANVADAVWIPGQRVIVYTSYDKPGLVVHSVDGRNAPLAKDQGRGSLMLSGDGRSLLWQSASKLQLLRVPEKPSKLLDPKAWETIAEFDLVPDYLVQYGALSNDGTIAVLGGPSKGANNLLAVLNLITGKSLVYSIRGAMVQLGWSRDQRYLIGSLFQPSKGGGSADLAAIRVDLSSVNHSGPIDWNNPEPASPQILLEMPLQTRSITWSESSE